MRNRTFAVATVLLLAAGLAWAGEVKGKMNPAAKAAEVVDRIQHRAAAFLARLPAPGPAAGNPYPPASALSQPLAVMWTLNALGTKSWSGHLGDACVVALYALVEMWCPG